MNKEEIKNEFINCIEESHTLNLAISILEDREELQQENKQLKEEKEELKKWLEDEKYILAKSVSHIYEDSLGHSKFVNEDIYNELIKVSDKIKELEVGMK